MIRKTLFPVLIARLILSQSSGEIPDEYLFNDILEKEAGGSGSHDDEAKADFGEFDINKDGEMDPHEIRAKFSEFLSPRDLFTFYAQADKDNSGTISLVEYLGYLAASM